ncbi:hypothetical protein FisN_7Lh140 [Fistulifera solaris]|uniref:DUF218 domain-containing protein n=1 Tax=Fistulifera solaris TaxID=1519565 RepID=A0A1Z5JCQ7_FISSO|nr:hypothetical protein FisN_7Lh140 [Fistulifera solaris]|eukprot:GAX11759.1 hypothetical protein FisN_7Lh140 [Fistulifera solaris]
MKIQRRKQFSPYVIHCTRQQRRIFGSLLTILAFVAYTTTIWAPMVAQDHAWVGLRTIQRKKWISNSAQPFNTGGLASSAKNLIIVAGHSVTISGHLEDANQDENDWFLLDYQRHRGLPEAIVGHIRAGIAAAQKDPTSLLVFSGGETRAATGPETEGASYYRVTDAMQLWPSQSTVRARTITEDFATDSFENLMFSICRFREVTGSYPDTITVVSFSFKQTRFQTMHAKALRWPPNRFQYIGVDPSASTGFVLEEAMKGELENSVKPFQSDPYGCHSKILQEKRKQRNPFSRTPPYTLSCPEMSDLLRFCGSDLIPLDKVPWGKRK